VQKRVAHQEGRLRILYQILSAVLVSPALMMLAYKIGSAMMLMAAQLTGLHLALVLVALIGLVFRYWGATKALAHALWRWLLSKFGWPFVLYLIALCALYFVCLAHNMVLSFKMGADWITIVYAAYIFTVEAWAMVGERCANASARMASMFRLLSAYFDGDGGAVIEVERHEHVD
jgi:hypothetical protein